MSAAGWGDFCAGVIRRCEVGAKFDGQVTFSTKEAKALGDLLADMALMLDAQIEQMDHGQISDATLKALQECKEKMRL